MYMYISVKYTYTYCGIVRSKYQDLTPSIVLNVQRINCVDVEHFNLFALNPRIDPGTRNLCQLSCPDLSKSDE